MGKKNANASGSALGKALIKDRFGKRNRPRVGKDSMLHTTEINDGQEWNRIDFNSITEQTHLDEFLETAELAGTEFQAVKLNMNFVKVTSIVGLPSEKEKQDIKEAQDANRSMLRIPRRPHWNILTTAEMLAESERNSFLEWRRSLAQLEETQNILMTPFERNLHFWRQLWRVIERSDVVVQIVDARNPLLFRCEDLEAYVKEVSPLKDNLILVNKSDFLDDSQRESWAEYFRQNDIKAVFFSALDEELDIILEEEESLKENNDEMDYDTSEDDSENEQNSENVSDGKIEEKAERSFETEAHDSDLHIEECRKDLENYQINTEKPESDNKVLDEENPLNSKFITTGKLFSKEDLIDLFKVIHKEKRVSDKYVTIGLVGYPNVGKSSTINSLMSEKKVSVSATPGKTKHFQTLFLNDDILLCDCPGLVFPAFVATKSEMIISGILPIDQMRDHVPSVNLVASIFPREFLENMYSINIPKPLEGEDPNRAPTSEELLNTYGFMRGYMTPRGQPDNPRTARYILKDYMNGKLLYCHAPPIYAQEEYHKFVFVKALKVGDVKPTPQQLATRPFQITSESIDKRFFSAQTHGFHNKGKKMIGPSGDLAGSSAESAPEGAVPYKPWRNKTKRNSKQKARKQFVHLDPKSQ